VTNVNIKAGGIGEWSTLADQYAGMNPPSSYQMYQDVETRIVFFTCVGGGKLPHQHESEAVSGNGVQPRGPPSWGSWKNSSYICRHN
jgi:hypothetical protein